MTFQSVTVAAHYDNTSKYVFFAAFAGMIVGAWLLRQRMTAKLPWAIAMGCTASTVLFWIPTFWLGWFDGHMAMFFLLGLYCPLVVCPFVCFASRLLRPNTKRQRLLFPVVIATALMIPSIAALTWRDHHTHFVQGWEVIYTFLLLVGLIGSEVLLISVPLSFAIAGLGRQLDVQEAAARY